MIEFSGVRSSCDMLARNWDLSRLASMRRTFDVDSPSYRRAFSREMAACTASSESTSSSWRSEEHTSELQSLAYLVCRLLLEKKKKYQCSTLIAIKLLSCLTTYCDLW